MAVWHAGHETIKELFDGSWRVRNPKTGEWLGTVFFNRDSAYNHRKHLEFMEQCKRLKKLDEEEVGGGL